MFLLYFVLVFGLACSIGAEADRCPSRPDQPCKKSQVNDAGHVTVNCTAHLGTLRLEDILCCVDEDAENGAGVDPEDVEAIYMVDSNVQELDFRIFKNFTNLHTLNVSNSNLSSVQWDDCTLPNLKYLDLSFNSIQNVTKEFFMCNRSLLILGLNGNPFNCEILKWFPDWVRKAEKAGLEIPEKESVICNYYSIQNEESLRFSYLWDIIDACPANCSCALVRFDVMNVDCSGCHYYDFPEQVPLNTRILHMENNAIHSFQRIINSSSYQNLTQLYLENNAIQSLKELEGIQRYLRISVMYLSGNRITEMSVHIMDQLMEQLDELKLGGNPWRCDCKQGTSLLNFLIDHSHRKIPDMDNITCAPTAGKHANKVVLRLSVTDMCYSDGQEVHYLDVVNVILGLLIIIVLVKLVYDWWQFKHSGHLPLGPTSIAHLWKQRLRLEHANLDCTKTLIAQRGRNNVDA